MAEPLNATFFLWRKREGGGVILRAMLGFIVMTALIIGAFVALTWGAWVSFFAAIQQGPSDDAGPVLAIFGIIGWIFVFMFVFYLLAAAYEAACLRWLVRRETEGFLGLSLGADTWRVYAGYWLWFGMSFVISNVAGLLMFPLVLLVMPGMMSAASTGATPDITPLIWVQLIMVFGQWIPLAYFGIRFAPGNATSIARRRFAYFDSWKVTSGRVLALAGSFVVLWLIWVVVVVVLSLVAFSSLLLSLVPLFTNPNDTEAVTRQLALPQTWTALGVCYAMIILTGAIISVAFMGVNARAAIVAAQEGKIEATLPDTVEQVFS